MVAKNLFEEASGWSAAEEYVEKLVQGPGIVVQRILSRGHRSPDGSWYDQKEDEWVALLQGRATIEWDDGSNTALTAGDWLLIRAHQRHRVASTSVEPACVWLALHGELSAPPS